MSTSTTLAGDEIAESVAHLSVFCPIEISTWSTSQGRIEIQILNAADPREAARPGPLGWFFSVLASDESLYRRRRVGLGTAHRDHRLS